MKYELPIYGVNDEVVKRHATNICPWGVYIQAASVKEQMHGMSELEKIKAIGDLLMCIFPELTADELNHADSKDVLNTFAQVVSDKKINPKN